MANLKCKDGKPEMVFEVGMPNEVNLMVKDPDGEGN